MSGFSSKSLKPHKAFDQTGSYRKQEEGGNPCKRQRTLFSAIHGQPPKEQRLETFDLGFPFSNKSKGCIVLISDAENSLPGGFEFSCCFRN